MKKDIKDLKVKCVLDTVNYTSKPTSQETAIMQKRLATAQAEISVGELAKRLTQGCTFKPALLNGSTSDTWISQQIFALDFDYWEANNILYYSQIKNLQQRGDMVKYKR